MLIEGPNLLKKGKSPGYSEQRCSIPRRPLRNNLKTDNSDRKMIKIFRQLKPLYLACQLTGLMHLNKEVDSDYDADDYLTSEALRQKVNTAEDSFSEVLPVPDLVT
ncbi:hypothetical protein Trydic_g19577 [Trypoxylus dichotomus]